jgi:hypothetical protein
MQYESLRACDAPIEVNSSVCLKQHSSSWMYFHQILCWKILLYLSVSSLQFCLKSNSSWHFTRRLHFYAPKKVAGESPDFLVHRGYFGRTSHSGRCTVVVMQYVRFLLCSFISRVPYHHYVSLLALYTRRVLVSLSLLYRILRAGTLVSSVSVKGIFVLLLFQVKAGVSTADTRSAFDVSTVATVVLSSVCHLSHIDVCSNCGIRTVC